MEMPLTNEEGEKIEELPVTVRKAVRLLHESPSTIRAILREHNLLPAAQGNPNATYCDSADEESDSQNDVAQSVMVSDKGNDPLDVPQATTASALQKHGISLQVRIMGWDHVQAVYRKAPRGTTKGNMHKLDVPYRGVRRVFRAHLQELPDFKVGLTFTRHSLPAQGRILSAMMEFCAKESWEWGRSEMTVTALIMSLALASSTAQKRRENPDSPKASKRVKLSIEQSKLVALPEENREESPVNSRELMVTEACLVPEDMPRGEKETSVRDASQVTTTLSTESTNARFNGNNHVAEKTTELEDTMGQAAQATELQASIDPALTNDHFSPLAEIQVDQEVDATASSTSICSDHPSAHTNRSSVGPSTLPTICPTGR